jgi:hypothetical protein
MHPIMSSPCLNIISGPSKIVTTTLSENDARTKKVTPSLENPCPVAYLPYELRQLIYESYIRSLPPVTISKANAACPLHLEHALSQSSPFFVSDIPPSTFHQQTTFAFSCGSALNTFSSSFSRRKEVRKIRIEYGKDEVLTRDWVYLLSSCFERLEEVSLSVTRETGVQSLGGGGGL